MFILAIETSCDETAIALVQANGGLRAPKFKVLESIIASQIKIHRPFGGVVPNLAKREHIRNLPILLKRILKKHKNFWEEIDIITVTVGPGLEPALWTGITFAEELAKKYKKPLVGANHLEGHLYSFLLPSEKKTVNSNLSSKGGSASDGKSQNLKLRPTKIFPAVALIVSGGHTILLKLTSLSKWKKLGETRDDAAGECFDKIARLLALPYPGGPEVEKVAKKGNARAIPFPRPMMNQKNYEFSFSGLKTSVLYYLRDHPKAKKEDIAASAQEAIVETLVKKTIRATSAGGGSASGGKESKVKSIILCGGVAANSYLRNAMGKAIEKLNSHERIRIAEAHGRRRAFRIHFFVPDFAYNTDNAVMIAAAGYMVHSRHKKYKIAANGNLGI